MKKIISIYFIYRHSFLLQFFAFAIIIFSPISHAVASQPQDCIEKTSEQSKFSGVVITAEVIDNSAFVIMEKGKETIEFDINYDELAKYRDLIGKTIEVDYRETQYWDEHDDMCVQRTTIEKINILDSSPSANNSSGVQTATGWISMERGIYFLLPPDGQKVYLGDISQISQNKKIASCLEDANRRAIPVRLNGKIETKDGMLRFIDDEFSCPHLVHNSRLVNYEGCFGPKIAGLQLGMSEPAAKNIIAEYAHINNIRFDDGNKSLGAGEDKYFDVGFFGTKTMNRFAVGKKFFGVTDLQNKDFMQKFMQEYDIPEMRPEKYQGMFGKPGIKYTYENTPEGYSITIFPNEIMVDSCRK